MEPIVQPAIIKRITDAEEKLEASGGLQFHKYGVGAWSASKLKMLEKCPYQFYLNYILKVKPDDDYVQDTSMADVGTTAHRILEHVVLGKSIDEAYALTKKEHCNVDFLTIKKGHAVLSEEKWAESIVTLEGSIMAFKEKLETFERNHTINRKLTELRLGVTRDWKPTTFFADNVYFRGIIDLIIEIETEPGYAPDGLIIDHKHGGGEFGGGVRNYEQQLDIYKPLYHFGYRKLSGATAGINFIKAGHTAYGEYDDAETIEKKLLSKLEWLIEGAIDTVKELGFFKHIRGNHCQYCVFNDQCKAGDLKKNELSTKKYFEIKKIETIPPWNE
jgi:hypothetical protein